jgi:hypothetical protein
LGELVKCKTPKSILPPKTHVRLDKFGLLAGFQRLWSDMLGWTLNTHCKHFETLS